MSTFDDLRRELDRTERETKRETDEKISALRRELEAVKEENARLNGLEYSPPMQPKVEKVDEALKICFSQLGYSHWFNWCKENLAAEFVKAEEASKGFIEVPIDGANEYRALRTVLSLHGVTNVDVVGNYKKVRITRVKKWVEAALDKKGVEMNFISGTIKMKPEFISSTSVHQSRLAQMAQRASTTRATRNVPSRSIALDTWRKTRHPLKTKPRQSTHTTFYKTVSFL